MTTIRTSVKRAGRGDGVPEEVNSNVTKRTQIETRRSVGESVSVINFMTMPYTDFDFKTRGDYLIHVTMGTREDYISLGRTTVYATVRRAVETRRSEKLKT